MTRFFNIKSSPRTLLMSGITLAASVLGTPSAAYTLDQNSPVFGLLNAAEDNSWVRLDQNSFDSVWAPRSQTLQPGSFGLQYKIIEAWSSFAWDPNRGQLIFWGGGHANYTGNDVYTFNIETLLWERASLPSAIVKPAPDAFRASYVTVDGVDNAPISSHTYDSQFYFRNADRFVTMGGAAFNDGNPFFRFVENPDGSFQRIRTGPYFWDPAKADPDKVGGLTGSHVDPANNPGVVGGEMWENRDLATAFGSGSSVNTTSALDPDPTIDRVLLQNNLGIYEYIVPDVNDRSLDTITRIARFGNSAVITARGSAGFDPVRNIYVRILDSNKNGNNAFTFWDLSTAAGGPTCPTFPLPCNALVHINDIDVVGGTFDYENTDFYALDFDPNRNAFLLWAGMENVWSLELPADLYNGRWTLTKINSVGGAAPAEATEVNPHTGFPHGYTGILGSWKYVAELDVFVGSHDGRGEIWAYRPANWQFADDTVGGGNTAPVIQSVTANPAQITDQESSLLSVSASDSDGDSLTYLWELPAGVGSLDDPESQAPVFSPSGVSSQQNVIVSVSVSDGISVRSSEVTVTVSPSGSGAGNSFTDNFDDGNLNGWLNVSEGNRAGTSDWVLRGGEVCQTSNVYAPSVERDALPKLGGYLQYLDGNFADADISFTMSSGDDDGLGLMFRVRDSQNYYRFSWDRQRSYRRLVKSVNGVFTLLAEDSVRYTPDQDYDISIITNGSTLSVSIDGQPVFTVDDGDIASGTIALYTWGNVNGCFDNVAVTALDNGGNNGNSAPIIQSVTASPAQITDQENTLLSVSASDEDGDPLTYLWELPSGVGSLDEPTSETPVFSPSTVFGPQNIVITVTVSDGIVTRSSEVTVAVSPSGPAAGNSFQDNFDDGNLNGWLNVSEGNRAGTSDWVLRDGKVCQNSNVYAPSVERDALPKLGGYLQYLDGDFADANISFTMSSGDDDSLGVMFRVQDNNNYYRFSWDRQRSYRRLVKSVNGVFTLLAEDSVRYTLNQDYDIGIVTNGSTLSVSIDGEPVFTVDDGDIASGTIALYTWGNINGCFDNVVVTAVDNGGNSAPVIQSVTASPAQITDQESSMLSVSASDNDGDVLSYLWELPAGVGSLDNPSSETPVFTPDGVFSTQDIEISVSVSDGNSSRRSEVTVTVSPSGAVDSFYEDFNDGDFNGWTIIDDAPGASSWRVRNGVLEQVSNIHGGSVNRDPADKNGTYLRFDGGNSFTDFNASLNLRSSDDDALGVMFRVQDNDNYYRFSWDRERSYRRLVKKVNGVYTLLAEDSVPYTALRDYQIEVDAVGENLQITIDGSTIFSVVDSDISGGTIGLYSWGNAGSSFDDVLVIQQ